MSHPYKFPPMGHQVVALKRAWKKPHFALFHEMGTGKTFTTINLAAGRFLKDQIDSLVVICPTPIKLVWELELEKMCPVPYEVLTVQAGQASKEKLLYFTEHKTDALKVVIVGVEALSQGNAFTVVRNFAKLNRPMAVCDESSKLKNAKTNRTKNAAAIARECLYRIILTGTPITQGMEDLFGQFQFLHPKIIGMRSYFQFRNMYCVMGGFEGKQVLGYQNTDALMKKVSPYIDIVKKDEVLDLPPKLFERIGVEPTKQQLKLIADLKHEFMANQDDKELMTRTVLERLTRFQQIIGGNFPFNEEEGGYSTEPIQGPNPKIDAVMDLLEDLPLDTKVIIWARFIPEIELIRDRLRAKFGDQSTVTFYGKDGDDERKTSVHNFQVGDARFMVSNPSLGGMGQTWTAATVVIYYSNSFSYEDRMQSEDRAHRKGQEHPVTYIDIEVNHPYDRMILAAVKRKGGIAKFVEESIYANQLGEALSSS
jgi:SNF2 family DNA or RNA helicase